MTREQLEAETDVEFVKAGGPGGQHRNKRETGVRLLHRPTGQVAQATERRSQAQNRELAFQRLESKLAELFKVKKKRRPTRPSKGAVERRLQAKKEAGQRKEARRKPDGD